MARKRVYKKRNNKRRYRRQRIPRTMTNKQSSYLPTVYTTRLKSIERRAIVCTSGTVNYLQYGLNCLYDPYLGAGGDQALGFDQLIALYDDYVVTACAYSIHVTTTGTGTGTNNIYYAVAPHVTTMVGFEPELLAEQPRGRLMYAYPGAPFRPVKGYCKMSTLFGVPSSSILSEISYSGNVSNNPPAQAFLSIGCQPIDQSSSATVFVVTKLVFYARFYNLKVVEDV